jgi:hypothetical protein
MRNRTRLGVLVARRDWPPEQARHAQPHRLLTGHRGSVSRFSRGALRVTSAMDDLLAAFTDAVMVQA